jgi:hypothetical protein
MTIKYIKTASGHSYIGEVVDESAETLDMRVPLLVENRYNQEQQPVFRYLPWQILSNEEIVTFNKNQIVFSSVPKVDLIDVYDKINISFIPIEDEDEEMV